jgi:predicted permease
VNALRRLRGLFGRLIGLRVRAADEARVSEELRFHLEQLTERHIRHGLSPGEARRRAALEFGGLLQTQEAARDELRAVVVDQCIRDVRVAFRKLRRAPVLTLSVVATLGICIGATTGMFSIVNAVLLRGLPYRSPDRLVWISSVRTDRPDAPFSLPEFMDFRARVRTVDVGTYSNWSATLKTADLPQRLQGMRMSAHGMEILGARASAGRLLSAADDAPGADRVVVISYALWQRQFGGDSRIIGSGIQLNGETYSVVGVLPRHFPLPLDDVDVVVPLRPDRDPLRYARNSVNFLRLFGRLAGSGATEAENELTAITRELREQYPVEYARKVGVRITPLREYMVGDYRRALFLLLGSAALMLGIAFANLFNLLLIRATARQGEIVLSRALGATTWNLVSAAVAEGALLAGAGGALGAILAQGAVWLGARLGPLGVLRLDEARVDASALLVALGLSFLATALFSLVPLGVSRRAQAQAALAAYGRMRSGTRAQSRLRAAGIVAQVALALVLASGTATMLGSFVQLQRLDLGYRPDSVFIARLSLPPQKYARTGDVARFHERLHEIISTRPDVIAAGVVSVAPLSGLLASVPFAVVGGPDVLSSERTSANFRAVSPGYLAAIRAPMMAGRMFTEADDSSAVPVAIVSKALADRYLPGHPIGRQLLIDDNNDGPRPVTVVGVVANLRHITIDGQPTPDVLIPLAQVHRDGVILVTNNQFWTIRLSTPPAQFNATFVGMLREVDRDVAASKLGTMPGYVDAVLAPRRFSVTVALAFAGVALVLAAVGVYGVMAYSVELRRREIAVRLALGESPRAVIGLVLRGAFRVVALGVVLGAAGALAGGRAMEELVFGMAPGDLRVLSVVALLLAFTTVVASWLPARKAAHIDPILALAGE